MYYEYSLNISHDNDDPVAGVQSSRDRLMAAMTLMGFAYDENGAIVEHPDQLSEVVYRKKHIRLSNRNLKLHYAKTPRHTYFDDDGCEVPEKVLCFI